MWEIASSEKLIGSTRIDNYPCPRFIYLSYGSIFIHLFAANDWRFSVHNIRLGEKSLLLTLQCRGDSSYGNIAFLFKVRQHSGMNKGDSRQSCTRVTPDVR